MKLSLPPFLKKLSKREIFILSAGGTLILMVIIYDAAVSPILTRLKLLDKEIKIQEEVIKRSIIIVANKDRLVRDETQYGEYLSKSESEEKETNVFLKEIETLAKETYVYLGNIRATGVRKEAAVRQYFVDIDFECKMPDLITFFYKIENSKSLFKIERFQIKQKSEGSEIATASATISKAIIPKEGS